MTDRRYAQLPDDKFEEVNDLYESFLDAWDDKKAQEADQLVSEAWHALPEPKLEWDYFSNVMPVSFTEFYRDTGEFEKAWTWLERARVSYGPEEDVSIEFLAGTVAYRAGDLERAFDRFNFAYEGYGKRPFAEEPDEYLQFTLTRRKNDD